MIIVEVLLILKNPLLILPNSWLGNVHLPRVIRNGETQELIEIVPWQMLCLIWHIWE